MDVPVIWSIDCGDYEPECPGPPPPFFHLPPPPRPPFLHDLPDCSLELETCNAMPVIDAEYHSSPALPSVAVIVSSSVFLLAMLLVATALLCKHKKKMQSFLPCKSSPQNHCDVTHGNGVIYEDLTNIRPRPLPQPSIEMLDVKGRCDVGYPPTTYPVLSHSPVFICPPPPRTMPHPRYCSQDLYNPVYEELSNVTGRGGSEGDSEYGRHGVGSEDEFAEDELSLAGVSLPIHHSGTSSLQGSTGNDLSRDIDSSDADDRNRSWNFSLPPGSRPRKHGERRPRSLERRRTNRHKGTTGECAEFHEGLLLDALLQLYPNRPIPTGHHKLPYILPVPHGQYETVLQYHNQTRPSEFTSFRPSHDSDSGYSHNTSGGRNSTSRARKHSHRVPHSNDIVIS
uniref:Uncharacterized protein n=2 Tax=Lygus hesperus TaxID=30085 RepID=A0A146M292_LYGHE